MTERTPLIIVRGAGETWGGPSMLMDAAKRGLDLTQYEVFDLPYSASYGGAVGEAQDFHDSQAEGRRLLLELLAQTGPAVLWGYSAGAFLAGNVAREIALGQHLALSLIAVGLVSDPGRHPDQIIGPNRGGYGIKGARLIPHDRFPVWQFSAQGDAISELPVGNPLRSLADITESMSPDFPEWMGRLFEQAQANQWQRWWDIGNWMTWGGAIAWAKGYLFDGRHTCYWHENIQGESITHLQMLALLTRDEVLLNAA
jgi:hypothetical protein